MVSHSTPPERHPALTPHPPHTSCKLWPKGGAGPRSATSREGVRPGKPCRQPPGATAAGAAVATAAAAGAVAAADADAAARYCCCCPLPLLGRRSPTPASQAAEPTAIGGRCRSSSNRRGRRSPDPGDGPPDLSDGPPALVALQGCLSGLSMPLSQGSAATLEPSSMPSRTKRRQTPESRAVAGACNTGHALKRLRKSRLGTNHEARYFIAACTVPDLSLPVGLTSDLTVLSPDRSWRVASINLSLSNFWPGRCHGCPITRQPHTRKRKPTSKTPLLRSLVPTNHLTELAFFFSRSLGATAAALRPPDVRRVRVRGRRPVRVRPPLRRRLWHQRRQQVSDDEEEGRRDQGDHALHLLLAAVLLQRLCSRTGEVAVQSGRVQLLDVEGAKDTLRRARVRAAHRAHTRVRRVCVPLEVQHPGAGQEVQGVRHRPARLRVEREGAGGVRRHHLDGAGLRLPQGGRQIAVHPRRQQLGGLHDAVHSDRAAGAGPGRRAAQLRRAVRGPQRAAQGGRGGGKRRDEARRQAAQGGLPAGRARVPLLAGQAAGQGRESLEKRVQRSQQRRRLPHRLHHGADGGPQRRGGVLQADVAVHGEPEPVHAGQAAEQAVVPAAASVGGPGPVGRAGQGRADQGVLPKLHRRQPAGRPLSARRGAGAGQRGAARVARVPGDRHQIDRAQSPSSVIPAPEDRRGRSTTLEKNRDR